MTRRSLLLGLALPLGVVLLVLVAWLVTSGPRTVWPVAQLDPYAAPELAPYRDLRDAREANDLEALRELSEGEGFVALRAARLVAGRDGVSATVRAAALRRVLELRPDEPLARAQTRGLQLRLGRALEEAGERRAAWEAYREALPRDEAVAGVERLASNAYRLANAFLQADMEARALDALGERAAPSIEAPAHRALGQYERALDAYERWAEAAPDSLEARAGMAWSHWHLGRLDRAEALFATVPGKQGHYGRALIHNRRGDVDAAVEALHASGRASHLWLATDLLEREGREERAIDTYLRLAASGSSYADDAAYRAHVLAERNGLAEAAAEARARLPQGSFFDLRLGGSLDVALQDQLPRREPDAVRLANALMRVHDREAAVGELVFALAEAEDEATVAALGEKLHDLEVYRPAYRAAAPFLEAGSREQRTWRLAYPRAWEERVRREAEAAGVNPELVWAVMRRESAFFPRAVSRSGAQGLMQVMPSTWGWLSELQDEPSDDPFDVAANIRYGVFYLGWLHDYFEGDTELMVASYNRGQGYVGRLFENAEVAGDKDELFRSIDAHETREYLQAVLRSREVYRILAASEDGPGPVRQASPDPASD